MPGGVSVPQLVLYYCIVLLYYVLGLKLPATTLSCSCATSLYAWLMVSSIILDRVGALHTTFTPRRRTVYRSRCHQHICATFGFLQNANRSSADCHTESLPITKWPCQSRAPVGAAPPTRSQLRLQRHTQVPVQAETIAATSPP